MRDPELAEEFNRSVIGKKREHLHSSSTAAIDRGELPADADVELIAEAPARVPLAPRALRPADHDDLLDRILDLALR